MKISLCMIVKDESEVIQRCLRSLLPIIDAWTVVDTGSSDNTPELVHACLGHLPGQLYERPWQNFGHNRTEAFELNRERGDYHLVVDADDWLELEENWRRPVLQADSYQLTVHHCGILYRRPHLFRTALEWKFMGVLHEFAHCPLALTSWWLEGLNYWNSGGQGARSRNPHKYQQDAIVLEAALQQEPENSRYAFYLAQSYRDAGMLTEASGAYQQRTQMAGWSEERYVSHLERARLLRRLSADQQVVQGELLAACDVNPQRAEALVELAQVCREGGQWNLAHWFAERAAGLSAPANALFVEQAVYNWRALDELSLAKFYTGQHHASWELARQLLSNELLPSTEQERIRRNESLCRSYCQGEVLFHAS